MTVYIVYLAAFVAVLVFWGFHIYANRQLAKAIHEHNERMKEFTGQTDVIGFWGTKISFFDPAAPTPTMGAGNDAEKKRVGFI